MLSAYYWIYLVSDTIGTYIIFKLMCIFFDRSVINKKIEWISYVIYYIVIALIYIAFDTMILNIISNLVAFYLLTLNYRATIKKRLTAVIFVYSLLCSIEAVVALLSIYLKLDTYIKQTEIIFIIEFFSMRSLSYVLVLFLARYKTIKEDIKLPFPYWIATIIISSAALFLTIVLINHVSNDNYFLIVISIVILFITNIFVFYLYNALLKTLKDKNDKESLQPQNNSYIRQ